MGVVEVEHLRTILILVLLRILLPPPEAGAEDDPEAEVVAEGGVAHLDL